MLRDITLGQYYPADSILHRLDPRVKFVGTLVYVISLFLFHNWGYLLGTVFLAVMIKLSKVPFKFITKGLKSIFPDGSQVSRRSAERQLQDRPA